MKLASLLCMVAVTAVWSGHAAALYKCTTAQGVVYQDRPCKEGAEEGLQLTHSSMLGGDRSATDQAVAAKADAGGKDEKIVLAKAAAKKSEAADRYPAVEAKKTDAATKYPAGGDAAPTAEVVRRTDPLGTRYYAAFGAPGAAVPENITCQTAGGEKWQFVLQGGK
jgi:hypothetical protein